ncbi:hypothetical protein NQ317_004843, partial [Molorchus minor]
SVAQFLKVFLPTMRTILQNFMWTQIFIFPTKDYPSEQIIVTEKTSILLKYMQQHWDKSWIIWARGLARVEAHVFRTFAVMLSESEAAFVDRQSSFSSTVPLVKWMSSKEGLVLGGKMLGVFVIFSLIKALSK